jgi:hypothetical protein
MEETGDSVAIRQDTETISTQRKSSGFFINPSKKYIA